ncbi:MAG: type II secretion system protein [Nanoarchaeota archaeon]
MKKSRGFTLLELLIVLGIISIIMLLGSTVYSSVQKRSRDAKRKGDLNIIRSSLELYRTNYSYYPTTLDESPFKIDYLKAKPTDPTASQNYIYTPVDCGGVRCKYILGAKLELSNTSSCTLNLDCGSGNFSCNFCLGPYGENN